MRRGSIRCPRRKRLVSCAVCCWPRFSRCSAASFCCAFGPAAEALPCRDALNPPRSLSVGRFPLPPSPFPRLPLLLLFAIASALGALLVLIAAGHPYRPVSRNDRLSRLGRVVSDQHQVEITVGDLAFAQDTSV